MLLNSPLRSEGKGFKSHFGNEVLRFNCEGSLEFLKLAITERSLEMHPVSHLSDLSFTKYFHHLLNEIFDSVDCRHFSCQLANC